jgi:hypothetical protein
MAWRRRMRGFNGIPASAANKKRAIQFILRAFHVP